MFEEAAKQQYAALGKTAKVLYHGGEVIEKEGGDDDIYSEISMHAIKDTDKNRAVLKLMFEFERDGDKLRCTVYRRARWSTLDVRSRAAVQELRSSGEALRV